MDMAGHVTIWGDSVMRGVIYNEEKGRYTLLDENSADRASRRLGLTLNNRARMGCTVTKGLAILKRDLCTEMACDAALIEFGGNDCDYDWAEIAARPEEEHQPRTSLALFSASLKEMVEAVRMKGILPVMMTLPPIDAERYFRFFTRNDLNGENIRKWLGDVQHIYRWHERYNAAVTRVARECDCPLAGVREAFLSERNVGELLCADGIHPNRKGHALIESVLEGFGLSLERQAGWAVSAC